MIKGVFRYIKLQTWLPKKGIQYNNNDSNNNGREDNNYKQQRNNKIVDELR